MIKCILEYQRSELTGSILYEFIANREKDAHCKAVFLEISQSERNHYETWKKYTGKDVRPNFLKITFFKVVCLVLGYTFTIKFFEQMEKSGICALTPNANAFPEIQQILADEEEHENKLIEMLDEERLHYVGSMVLGLNDALVELTGTIAGLSFALMNTRLVALSAIITGVAATLSMAASNYLAQRAEGNEKAIKSSFYTGMAYLITVALMVLPYLLLPNELYLVALGLMLTEVVLIILLFNYYISVAQSLPFLKRFGEMAAISMGVAVISFGIGLLAKFLLGVDVS